MTLTELYRTQAKIIINNVNPNIHDTEQGDAMGRKYKTLKLGGGQAPTTVQLI
jgi:hypothetical protein